LLRSSNNDFPDYLILGKVLKPRGLKGEVKIFPFFKDFNRLLLLEEVYLNVSKTWEKYWVERSVVREGFWYVFFKNVDSLEKAEQLRNSFVSIPGKEAPSLPPCHHYHFQLYHLFVKDAVGKFLGKVVDVVNHEVVDYLIVEGDSLFSIPLVDTLIENINLDKGEIFLKVPWV